MTLSEFVNMGGYAAYVWPSYALGLVVLIANYIAPRQRERKLLRQLRRRARRDRTGKPNRQARQRNE